MEQVIFYQVITSDKVIPLRELLTRWYNNSFLSEYGWVGNMLEKACVGSHLIISTRIKCPEKASVYVQPDSIDNIKLISIWRNRPNTYSGMHSTVTFVGIPAYTGLDKDLKIAIQELQSIFLNTTKKSNPQQNGESENRLQEERAAGAGLSEGRILYGGRDIPEYSAGRHCDQAGTQESPIRDSRPQIILSSRRSQILGA